MKQFLRENWIYIVAPLALVLMLLIALILFGGDSTSGFFYSIF